jgi:hypothetical protein
LIYYHHHLSIVENCKPIKMFGKFLVWIVHGEFNNYVQRKIPKGNFLKIVCETMLFKPTKFTVIVLVVVSKAKT